MPGRVVPVLDIDQLEPRTLGQEDLDGPDVERRSFSATSPGRFANQRGFGPVFEHHQRVAQVDTPLLDKADQTEERSVELHPLGHIKQCAARPERRVQRREDIVRGLDRLGQQITLEQLGVVFDRPIQIDENRPPEARRIGLACQGAVDVLDAGGVMRAQRPPEIVESALGLGAWLFAGRRPEGVEPQPADVGPPPLLVARAGPGERLKPGERLATALDQPGGLVALAQERLEGSSVKPRSAWSDALLQFHVTAVPYVSVDIDLDHEANVMYGCAISQD